MAPSTPRLRILSGKGSPYHNTVLPCFLALNGRRYIQLSTFIKMIFLPFEAHVSYTSNLTHLRLLLVNDAEL